jgi:hypothetical protein
MTYYGAGVLASFGNCEKGGALLQTCRFGRDSGFQRAAQSRTMAGEGSINNNEPSSGGIQCSINPCRVSSASFSESR